VTATSVRDVGVAAVAIVLLDYHGIRYKPVFQMGVSTKRRKGIQDGE
jgi:hypothetical protein